jgi:hypothetical protein
MYVVAAMYYFLANRSKILLILEEFYFLGCNAMQFVESQQTFRG